ncbi:MAG: AAA family ATPase [Planctomycetes bacterium]|nr:AAA family ATPase [Planctomycetota bacterium]
MRFFSLSELPPRPLEWLWPGRLALGKLAILEGDPGLSKSLLTLDLCARLTTGRPFPDDSPSPGPANVIILNAEDSLQDTIIPRLQRLQADLSRVFTPDLYEEDSKVPLAFPARLDVLDDLLDRTQARLVILDPINAFLEGRVNIHNDQSVRGALAPLAWLADRRRCVVQFVRHLNKSGGTRSLYRGGGSIGFMAACRCAWLAARDPQEPSRRILAEVKNNLAPPQSSLAYTVAPYDSEAPLITWLGTSSLKADALLARPALNPSPARPRELAKNFLEEVLQDGPRPFEEILARAQEAGLTARTVQRASKELEIQSLRVFLNGRHFNYWLLSGQQLPAHIPTSAIETDPDELLGSPDG